MRTINPRNKWLAILVLLLGLSVLTDSAWALVYINTDTTLDSSLNEPAVITNNCTVTLNGVNFTAVAGDTAITVNSGVTVTFILSGVNQLTGGVKAPGILVPPTAGIVIKGDGSLTVTGGRWPSDDSGGGSAGIGGKGTEMVDDAGGCGSVVIRSGTVSAIGGDGGGLFGGGGAGIGGGGTGTTANGGNGGTVVIEGGTVTAKGGASFNNANAGSGAGIGGGGKGGAVDSGNAGSAGSVTISGGIVKASAGTSSGYTGKDIGRGGDHEAGSGITVITGGSVQATTVDGPTYDGVNSVEPYSTFPLDYTANPSNPSNAGKTLSFQVAAATPYTYVFTVPGNQKVYLWLPAGITPPAVNDVSGATVPTLTSATAAYNAPNCVVTLNPGSFGWDRINQDGTGFTSGTGTTDSSVTAAGAYLYRAKSAPSGTMNLTAYSDYHPITLVAPAITNAATALSAAQGATGTLAATATGTPTPVFSATLQGGNPLPSWITVNASTGAITATPAAGQATGDTVITITAKNGLTPVATKDFTITVTAVPSGGDPDPTDPAQSVAALLSNLNAALGSKTSVAGLSSIPAAVGTPITKAASGNATFTKKDTPMTAFPGYTALAPSFSSSVMLNANTTGNVLALKYTVNVASLSGFENWATLTDDQRAALLDSQKIIFAYEYADKTWKTLVGAGGVLSWADALKANIVTFTATGLSLNYAVTDATGSPAANGSVMVIPDGAKDNKIVDPVWLMTGSTVPASVTLNQTTLILRPGATFQLTATVSPDTATNKKVKWSSSNTNFASVDQAGKVTAVALGTAIITVTTDDGGKTATCTVTVNDEALEIDLSGLGLVNNMLEIAPGETIDLRIETDPAGATCMATGLPQGLTLTSDGHLTGTVPQIGTYTVTVTATLNGETVSETFTIEVTKKGVNGGSSSGGCDARLSTGFAGLVLAALVLTRRKRERV